MGSKLMEQLLCIMSLCQLRRIMFQLRQLKHSDLKVACFLISVCETKLCCHLFFINPFKIIYDS